MDLPRSRAVAPVLEYLSEAGSTNDELVARAVGADAAQWPDLSALVTDNQTSGRGRLGRTWVSPAGKCLAVSVLLRPGASGALTVPMERFGWFPLLAGVAMARAVSEDVADGVALKWPNDVLIGGAKVSGILSELLPDGRGVVIGAGLNVSLEREELPIETATSLTLAGAEHPDPDRLVAAYLRELSLLYRAFVVAGGEVEASGVRAEIVAECDTIGRAVRVELPSGETLLGTATSIDAEGRLLVESDGRITAVAAGDVTHLRY